MLLLFSGRNINVLGIKNRRLHFLTEIDLEKHIKNKYKTRFIYFTEYKKVINFLRDTNKADKIIFLANHGISKILDFIFSFDIYMSPVFNGHSKFGYFYVMFSGVDSHGIALVYEEIRLNSIMEDESITSHLLKDTSYNLPVYENVKIYFKNYKDYVLSFFGSDNIVYLYQNLYSETKDKFERYKNIFCEDIKGTDLLIKKKIQRNMYLNYNEEITSLIEYYIVLSSHRLITKLLFITDLPQHVFHKKLLLDLKKLYIVYFDSAVLVMDKLLSKNTAKKTSFSEINYFIRKMEASSFFNLVEYHHGVDNVYDKDSRIIDDTNGWLYLYYYKDQVKEKNEYNEQVIIDLNETSVAFSYKSVDMILYANNSNFYRSITNVFMYVEEKIEKPLNNKNELYKRISLKLLGYGNAAYSVNIPISFSAFLFGRNIIKEIKKFFFEKFSKNFSKRHGYIYKILQSFAGPIKVKIEIESDKCITTEANIIAEFNNEGETYYLFKVDLIKSNFRFSIKMDKKDTNNAQEPKVIIKRIQDNKGNSLDSIIMITFYYDKKYARRYIGNIFKSVYKISFIGIDLSFALKKEEWDDVKCTGKKISSIEGYFYLYVDQDINYSGSDDRVFYPLKELVFIPIYKKHVIYFS